MLIPARDEEALLPRCLESVQRSRKNLPPTVTSDVILVDDGSSDATYSIARTFLEDGGAVVRSCGRVVGWARALAAQTAIARFEGPTNRHWFANTDADCVVPDSWLLDHLAVASANIDAVAGIVSVDSFEEHGPGVRARFQASYAIHSNGTHSHVHGANLGVRCDAYLRAGGWSALNTAEDHDLWNRLRATGSSQVSISSLNVVTSGRRVGRAPLGFAGALAAHKTRGVEARF